MATNEYPVNHLENPPEWYWERGLHDAGITAVEAFELPFDYDKFVEQKSDYIRNLLILEIDLHDFDSHPEDFTFRIRFQRAEVVRA